MTNSTHSSKFPASLRAETLENAADLLENAGWTRGMFRSWDPEKGHDTYCTIGALQIVAHDPEDSYSYGLQFAVQNDIAEAMGLKHGHAVARWNDRHRIGANVIAKLRQVAAKLRESECS